MADVNVENGSQSPLEIKATPDGKIILEAGTKWLHNKFQQTSLEVGVGALALRALWNFEANTNTFIFEKAVIPVLKNLPPQIEQVTEHIFNTSHEGAITAINLVTMLGALSFGAWGLSKSVDVINHVKKTFNSVPAS